MLPDTFINCCASEVYKLHTIERHEKGTDCNEFSTVQYNVMELTIINNSSQHAALLVGLLVIGETLQVSEAG